MQPFGQDHMLLEAKLKDFPHTLDIGKEQHMQAHLDRQHEALDTQLEH